MPKQTSNIRISTFFLAIIAVVVNIFVFSLPIEANEPNDEGDTYIDINEDTIWHSTDDLDLRKIVFVNPGATLTIEKGAKIKFSKDIDGNDTYLSVGGGRIIANGTLKEPISITADSDQKYSLIEFNWEHRKDFSDPLPSFLRYVDISGGGYEWDTDCPDCSAFWHNLIQPAYAEIKGNPAIYFQGGKVHLENCTFHNNAYADIEVDYDEFRSETGTDDYLEVVNSNFEKYKDSMAVRTMLSCRETNANCINKVILKDNWYDSSQGPRQSDIRENSDGKEIMGHAYVDGWRNNNVIADPVIIIPGIMGAAEVSGVWKMDPILHTYDDLLESLSKNGYVRDKNLFEFPYNWENKNEDSANDLKAKVENIINKSKISKVDLVAHSMGGLVARQYIEDDNYSNNIDQLITLGTPQHGAVKDYMTWEAGEIGTTIEDRIIKHHFEMEALHNKHANLFSYIRDDIPSVKELLPDYDYLYDVSKSSMRSYPNNYPQNTFLDNLNKDSNMEKLKNVDFVNIIGVLNDDKSTISKMRVVDSNIDGRWEHGMPENFYDGSTDQGLEYDKGDGTVPKKSAENILADKTLTTNATHSDLPTVSQCAVLYELTGKEDCVKVVKTHIPNLALFNILSPIDVQIIDPDGKRIGKNFETNGIINEIPGAYYSGFDTDNEFLTIPNPKSGEYKILTKGTGEGEYHIEATRIWDDSGTGKAKEKSVMLAGTTTLGDEQVKNIVLPEEDSSATDEKSVSEIIVAAQTSSDDNDDNNHKDKKSKNHKKKKEGNAVAGSSLIPAASSASSSSSNSIFDPKKYLAFEDVKSDAPRVKGESTDSVQNREANDINSKYKDRWLYEILSVGILAIIITLYFFRMRRTAE